MDGSHNDASNISQNLELNKLTALKLTIKTPKEKKDISVDASSTVKQVSLLLTHTEQFIVSFY